jgi:hypothetical protein
MTYVRAVSRKLSRAENETHGVRAGKKASVVCSLSKLSMLQFLLFFAPHIRWWPMRCLFVVLAVVQHHWAMFWPSCLKGEEEKIAKKMS